MIRDCSFVRKIEPSHIFSMYQSNQIMKDYTRHPCYLELVAIIAVGALHVIMKLAHLQTAIRIYTGVVISGFLIYTVWRRIRTKKVFRTWGMRMDNFWSALRAQLIFGVPAAMFVYCFGLLGGSAPLPETFWFILVLYFLWGITQQFAVQNLVAKNLRSLLPQPMFHALVVALLFSVSHFPCVPLMVLVLVAGFFFTLIYQRNPNLWAVGIVHGVLGAMSYYLVLKEEPGLPILQFLKSIGFIGRI